MTDSKFARKAEQAAMYILEHSQVRPRVGMVLGSGWGSLTQETGADVIAYKDVPGMPVPTIQGHSGKWVLKNLNDVPVAIMNGRVHLYEGYSAQDVVFPIAVMQKMGIKTLILTNAAGCINTSWNVGDLMLLSDHINLTGHNPLVGPNDDTLGPRFPDMSHVYSERLIDMAMESAEATGVPVHKGVYVGLLGPSFETPAEIRMFRTMGADCAGMSTVLEAIFANYLGIEVLAASSMTNMAAGVLDTPLTHTEVLVNMNRATPLYSKMLLDLLKKL